MAIVIALGMRVDELQTILRRYGYCLSESVAADMVAKWFCMRSDKGGEETLRDINDVLCKMELPLLMTRIK